MNLKKPLTFPEQVDKLNQHGMFIKNKDWAISILEEVNYYKFTGYAFQFFQKGTSTYKPGTDFETVVNLYKFDTDLKHILEETLDAIEIFLKTQLANIFSIKICNAPPFDQHYNRNNYYKKNIFDIVMNSLDKEIKRNSNDYFVKHHINKYNSKMPLWVMVEILSFTSISMLYSAMADDDKFLIANKLGIRADMLGNHFHSLSVLRNKVAHNARLYNSVYNPPIQLGKPFLRISANKGVKNNTLFAYIIVVIRRLPPSISSFEVCKLIYNLINKYQNYLNLSLIGFPKNYKDILNEECKRKNPI